VTGKSAALATILEAIPAPIVAVSGGVDSMTLSHMAHRHGRGVRMVHAVSPAVPGAATERVKAHAEKAVWRLDLIDAGEFADPHYRANPVNRCYFCKHNLYVEIASRFPGIIISGTNLDDLADFRPGLRAAKENGVRHPFVEAGLTKADVRALAHALDLGDLAELPAAPCLSSRVQTGIAIEPATLALVDAVETRLRAALGPADIRCRVTARGIRLEFGEAALAAYHASDSAGLRAEITEMIAEAGQALVEAVPYRRGSAFVRAVHG
jgi:uncharacterized protein